MKTQMKKTSIKSTILLICIVLISFSCGQSNNNAESKKAEVPKLDIQAAIVMNDYNTVIQHIAAGTDLDIVEEAGGSTPLVSSIVFGREDIAKALIEAGADFSIKNNEGSDALFVAAMFCRTETLKLLLEAGADPETKNSYGSTPLMTAEAPFEMLKPVYDEIGKGLGPLGLKLDLERIKAERVVIADILKAHI